MKQTCHSYSRKLDRRASLSLILASILFLCEARGDLVIALQDSADGLVVDMVGSFEFDAGEQIASGMATSSRFQLGMPPSNFSVGFDVSANVYRANYSDVTGDQPTGTLDSFGALVANNPESENWLIVFDHAVGSMVWLSQAYVSGDPIDLSFTVPNRSLDAIGWESEAKSSIFTVTIGTRSNTITLQNRAVPEPNGAILGMLAWALIIGRRVRSRR